MSSITQDVIALNDYTQERRRTTSKGTKSRYTITVDAQPILHDFSETSLGAGPAQAIQAAIIRQIKAISEVAKPATIARRSRAKRLLESGVIEDNKASGNTWTAKKWIAEGFKGKIGEGHATIARYSGGRTGAKFPTGSVRLFNDSGRLAEGILVQQNTVEKNWTINVTANRLDPSTFGSQSAFLAMVARLRALVPVLANPLTDRDVVTAIEDGIIGGRDGRADGDRAAMIRKLEAGKNLKQALLQSRLALVKSI